MIVSRRQQCEKTRRFVQWFAALWILLVCVAAAPQNRPDAVIVTDPQPHILLSLFPAIARLDNPVLLVHTPGNEPYVTEYLSQIKAQHVWLFDSTGKAPKEWRQKFQVWPSSPSAILKDLTNWCWKDATSVVVVGGLDTELSLAGCLLAMARGLPAYSLSAPLDAGMRDLLKKLAPPEIISIGKDTLRPADFPDSKFTPMDSVADVLAAYETALGDTPIEHLVVVGKPAKRRNAEPAGIAPLVPQYAVRHRAAIAFLERHEDVDDQLQKLISKRYPSVRYVTLWGGVETLPDGEVEDPVAAAGLETKLADAKFSVAPLTGLARHEPCQFRVGRISGDSWSSVSLLAARSLHRPDLHPGTPPQVLILANTDYELPLLEAITRTTAQTFEKSGWQTRALYGWRTDWYRRFGRLWGADIVLYEGHTAYLAQTVKFDTEREPVYPGLYVFQGCKTLRQPEVTALLRNGAAGVVGTTTNTYSASGGALAKTYVDAMLIDQMDAGTSLMVARNFMLALADLKERRGQHQGPKTLRGGMTFSLWGDPTWKPPQSPTVIPDAERVYTVRKGNLIELHVPDTFAPLVEVKDYLAQVPLGGKLAGMYEWENGDRARRQLPPLYFAVVPLPDYEGRDAPTLSTPVAKNRWISLWDPRNRWLYLLVQSGAKFEQDQGKKLNFRIE